MRRLNVRDVECLLRAKQVHGSPHLNRTAFLNIIAMIKSWHSTSAGISEYRYLDEPRLMQVFHNPQVENYGGIIVLYR